MGSVDTGMVETTCLNCNERDAVVGELCEECDRQMMEQGYRGDGR